MVFILISPVDFADYSFVLKTKTRFWVTHSFAVDFIFVFDDCQVFELFLQFVIAVGDWKAARRTNSVAVIIPVAPFVAVVLDDFHALAVDDFSAYSGDVLDGLSGLYYCENYYYY